MESGLYEGVVRHQRLTPVRHEFTYRLFLAYLDLAEAPGLIDAGVISARLFGLASHRRADHFGAGVPLDRAVRDRVAEETGTRPTGPIRLLTQLGCLGASFRPLSLFYCFDEAGTTIKAVVAEVRNTPWRERHTYVLWSGNRESATDDETRHRHAKAFHVSPFMEMALDYRWRLSRPGERLRVDIENVADGATLFRAGLSLRRRELTRGNLWRMLVKHPLLPVRVTAAIYFQAFLLWSRRCPYRPHPKSSPSEAPVDSPGRLLAAGNDFAETRSSAD